MEMIVTLIRLVYHDAASILFYCFLRVIMVNLSCSLSPILQCYCVLLNMMIEWRDFAGFPFFLGIHDRVDFRA